MVSCINKSSYNSMIANQ
uniref:Uncharacterized protein n=1 Tax=Rhizophora mucronata TaxID=61149 RepID=A0A2P2QET3_RHIMU